MSSSKWRPFYIGLNELMRPQMSICPIHSMCTKLHLVMKIIFNSSKVSYMVFETTFFFGWDVVSMIYVNMKETLSYQSFAPCVLINFLEHDHKQHWVCRFWHSGNIFCWFLFSLYIHISYIVIFHNSLIPYFSFELSLLLKQCLFLSSTHVHFFHRRSLDSFYISICSRWTRNS